jgi:16S rRNA (uracil1498-N3)-methyltransferase
VNPALRRSAAHVFVETLELPALAADDHHHLSRVLRLREGEKVSVGDGNGGWRICRYATGGALEPDTDVQYSHRPVPSITIGFALPKADRPEWIVQKLTEIGVDTFVVLHTERSVVRWDADRAHRNLAKLSKVAREAAMQSRRLWLPTVIGPVTPEQLAGPTVALAEPEGEPLSLDTSTVLIGPEGGWTEAELSRHARHARLGSSILRVETAALVAAVQLSALRDIGSTV